MAARPRFLLVPTVEICSTRPPAADVPVAGWRFAPGAALIDTTSVGWRLLGANNRELGRGVATFSVGVAREHVRFLQSAADRLSTIVTSGPTGKWLWTASLDGEPVAVSSRSYHRHRECVYNARHFTAAVAIAGIGAARSGDLADGGDLRHGPDSTDRAVGTGAHEVAR